MAPSPTNSRLYPHSPSYGPRKRVSRNVVWRVADTPGSTGVLSVNTAVGMRCRFGEPVHTRNRKPTTDNAAKPQPPYAAFAAPRSPNDDSIFRIAGIVAVRPPTTANVE